jgi:uncharacterized cupredoxin-like copper-binding protein
MPGTEPMASSQGKPPQHATHCNTFHRTMYNTLYNNFHTTMKHFISKTLFLCTVTTLSFSAIAWAAGGHAHSTDNIGKAGDPAKVTRTIAIDMSDAMRFTPDTVHVKRGETIRFVVKNSGKLKHEFNLGTAAALKEHYAHMLKFPEMEHDEPNMVNVAPGETGAVVWQFTKAGTVSFACLHPGHYEAGMKGSIRVTTSK